MTDDFDVCLLPINSDVVWSQKGGSLNETFPDNTSGMATPVKTVGTGFFTDKN